jgi:hypothetical protein
MASDNIVTTRKLIKDHVTVSKPSGSALDASKIRNPTDQEIKH